MRFIAVVVFAVVCLANGAPMDDDEEDDFVGDNDLVAKTNYQLSVKKRTALDNPGDDEAYIVKLFPECPLTVGGIGKLVVKADVPAHITARCANGNKTFNDEMRPIYTLPINFTGNPVACEFFKKGNSNVYTVLVDMGWGEHENEMYFHTKRELVTCGYDQYGEVSSMEHRVQDFVLQAEENQNLLGDELVNATFTMNLLNVLDDVIDGQDIGQSRIVRLYAEMIGNYSGFRAISCNAENSDGQEYAVLRGGCGDGEVFPMDKGFHTAGSATEMYSPWFGAFKLRGANDLKFECTFSVCRTPCPGDSCKNV